jgi:hypothetical protein
MSVGGSIESVTIKGRTFAVAADADAARQLGGASAEVLANGDGTARIVKTKIPWLISGLALVINNVRGDLEFLQEIANGSVFVACDITFADGTTYQGQGTVTGELQAGSQNATAEVTLSGEGQLTKQ